MRKKYIILFFFCACFLRLTAQDVRLLHKTHGQRYPYLYAWGDHRVDDPDSTRALKEVNAIARMAAENGDDDLLMETKGMKGAYYHYQSVYGTYPPDLARAKITAVLEEAKQKGILWLEANTEAQLAGHYNVFKQYENAFEHAHKAYALFSRLSFEECPNKKNALSEIANWLYLFRDYRMALQYLFEAAKDSTKKPWDTHFIQGPNTMGLCYRALGKLDSSSYYFRIARERATKQGLGNWEAICDGNIGENYFLQKDYEKAKPLVQHDADVSAKNQDWGPAANALTILAEISLDENDLKNAEQLLTKAKGYAYLSKQDKRLAKLYPLLSRFYILTGNRPMASAYLDSSLTARDNVDREFNTLYRTRAVQKVELEKERFAVSELHHQQRIRTLQRNGLVVIVLLALAVVFSIYERQKRLYREKKEVEREKQRSEELLLNILPEEVAEELKAKGSADAKLIDEVTVLFTDFKGFTQLSEKLSPQALVSEINDCFSAFDHIMNKYNVEKIKTIGDSYMAAGGLPTPNKTHHNDVVKAAIEIQQYMQEHKKRKAERGELFFEIRIGVHTGPVIAGIVGVKKFQYDIWGDTVNIASRMESSGEVGKVNISQTTYDLVKDQIDCTYRGEVDAKGKGLLKMYHVS